MTKEEKIRLICEASTLLTFGNKRLEEISKIISLDPSDQEEIAFGMVNVRSMIRILEDLAANQTEDLPEVKPAKTAKVARR